MQVHCTSSEKMTKSLIESPCNHSRQWWRCCWLQGDTESMWPRASTERPSFSSQALLRMLTCSKQKCINPFCTLSQTLNTDFQVFSNQHFEASFFFFFSPNVPRMRCCNVSGLIFRCSNCSYKLLLKNSFGFWNRNGAGSVLACKLQFWLLRHTEKIDLKSCVFLGSLHLKTYSKRYLAVSVSWGIATYVENKNN